MKQNIGIPVGTDPGPDFVNLFLHFYEFTYMQNNTKTKYSICRKISKCCRYIDDIILFNSGSVFDDLKTEIYPEELILNKENGCDNKATFLDIEIKIIDKTFCTKLYDKRNDFNFNIVNFPFLCGNIPRKQSYGVFTSQLIRYSRVCSKYEDFLEASVTLVKKLLKQGYRKYLLKYYFNKMSSEYLHYKKCKGDISDDIFLN